MELTYGKNPRIDEVSVTCMAFPRHESATFWVGTEEGTAYQVHRFDRAGR